MFHVEGMTKIGNPTSASLPHKALGTDATEQGEATPSRAEELVEGQLHARSMAIGRAFAARYRRIMAALAK